MNAKYKNKPLPKIPNGKNKTKKKGKKITYQISSGSKKISGSGDYQVNPLINNIAKGLGGMASSYLGLGSDIGSRFGDGAHRAFKAITGYGEYKVKSNTLMTDNGAPIFKPQDRVMHIRHREFIGDVFSGGTLVSGATTFSPRTFNIVPSNAIIFPWLSAITKNFQQFRFKGLIFAFESKSGNSVSSTNAALGSVIMATDYNVNALKVKETSIVFKNKQEMEAHEFCTSSVSSCNMIHPIECSPKEQILDHFNILEFNQRLDTDDPKFYVPGILQVATVGQQAINVNLGELWVSYDIELLKTKKDLSKVGFHAQLTGNQNGGYFPPTQTTVSETIGFVSVNLTTGVLTVNSGFYGTLRFYVVLYSPASAITGNMSITPSGNAVASNTIRTDTVNSSAAWDAAELVYVGDFDCAGGGIFTFSNGYTTTDAGTNMDLFIDSVNNDEGY
jgi:hypothetical protein